MHSFIHSYMHAYCTYINKNQKKMKLFNSLWSFICTNKNIQAHVNTLMIQNAFICVFLFLIWVGFMCYACFNISCSSYHSGPFFSSCWCILYGHCRHYLGDMCLALRLSTPVLAVAAACCEPWAAGGLHGSLQAPDMSLGSWPSQDRLALG